MEPNFNFENENNNANDAAVLATTPRTVVITEMELAGLRATYSKDQIAEYYGISKEDLQKVYVEFGMVKQRAKVQEELPSYVIQTVRNMPVLNKVTNDEEVSA